MEGPDGFVRTITKEYGSDQDSDGSELDFATGGEHDLTAHGFFSDARAGAAPSAWNFEKARQTARAPEPYQTSIDEKIRTARDKIDAAPPTSENEDDAERKAEKKAKKKGGKKNLRTADEKGDAEDENADQADENEADEKNSEGLEDDNEEVKKKAKAKTGDKRVRSKKDNQPAKSNTDSNNSENEDKDGDSDDDDEIKVDEKAKSKKTTPGGETRPLDDGSAKKQKKRKKESSANASDDPKLPKSFTELHLSRAVQKAVHVLEWNEPTPIQARAIPYILAGRDVCASAVTGSGKTGAFVLPVLERLVQAGVDNVTRVVMLLPTRELAAQCHAVVTSLARFTGVRAVLAVGGLNSDSQQAALRTRPHIVIATPGRLIDHVRNSYGFSLDDVEVLVMDEADRLLDMGFQAEVEQIVKYINENSVPSRQTLLFSATITAKLKALINLSLRNPIHLAVDQVLDVAAALQQEFVKIRSSSQDVTSLKQAVLLALASRTFTTRTIVFFQQKITAHRLKILFGLANLKCAELHGNLTQVQRLAALDSFREGTVDFLLCTDLAARGLDIIGIDTVINYDLPSELREYVHRVGRTARAGRGGRACSFVCSGVADERRLVRAIGKRMRASSSSDEEAELTARVVPPAVVARWSKWVQDVEPGVRTVLKQEREERELRIAEMELQKTKNMTKYEADIYSRPAKTWFRSEKEKADEKARLREQAGLAQSEGRKRKANDEQDKREQERKRRKTKAIIARQNDFSKQRLAAKAQKRGTAKR